MNLNPFYWIDLKAQKDGFEEAKRLGLIPWDAEFKQRPMMTAKEAHEVMETIF